MNTEELKERTARSDYDFLRKNEHLGDSIIFLGVSGSYGYGTNTETSDLDIRGCALNSADEILLGQDFEQVTDTVTDTTVYSLKKLVSLLLNCNPNTIELLGLKPEHYFCITETGKMLIDNRTMFLSRKALKSFSGYADDQFRRMYNLSGRLADQSVLEEHILVSMNRVMAELRKEYADADDEKFRLYLSSSERGDADIEIFADVNLKHFPVRGFRDISSKLNDVVRSYEKAGKRNQNAVTHNKLGKHMMHLLRLYMMCIDILEKNEIITYREAEHDLLMSIRNGKYLDENSQPKQEFFELTEEYRKRLKYAEENTSLPDSPDYDRINEFLAEVNRKVVTGCI